MSTAIDDYLSGHAGRFEDELCELLRIPSVSADSTRKPDVRRAAEWVAAQFRGLGMATEMCETAGHPIVYAEHCQAPGAPTVLVYGHYDVQPPDPLNLWHTPPFEPTRRDGNLYARGATDDKGQMFTHIKSAEAWLKTVGKLPVNLKYVIEGEEEVGSEHLGEFIKSNQAKLKSDVCVVSDTSQFGPGMPAITYGLRGIAYFELILQGPDRDLHSGVFGGAVVNPAGALVKLLAGLVDVDGRIQLPGFYDDVVPLRPAERKQYADLPYDETEFMASIGVDALHGEAGFTNLERRSARPTFDINGLTSGYQGEGAKTVLPARASAKFSFRLVPNQDPAKIADSLRKLLAEKLPAGVKRELITYHGGRGIVVDPESPYISSAVRAIERGFGTKPVFIREGGSIPVVSTFHDQLGIDTLLLGWGLNDDNTHSPNEKFCLADFHRGIKSSAALWDELGKMKKSS
ncbi:MAG: dipeptidase [Planctomycetia bacterium]|nr:dipeptidase [Planctomycetia bacterium]